MRQLFFLSAIFFSLSSGHAQPSDLLILKKKLITIDTFFPGDEMNFATSRGYYNGIITSINNDSVFLIQYDVRQRPSNLGVYFLDTVATYRYGVNYREITAFSKDRSKKFNWQGSGGALFGGGILLTTVGMGTWLFSKPDTRYYASPYLVGGAALLGAIGYVLLRSGSKGLTLGKKYTLEYIRLK